MVSRVSVASLAAFALSLALAGPPAAAVELGLTRMIGALDAPNWRGVGRLNIGYQGFCTGALLNETLVVTAAHCLFDPETGEPVAAGRLTFLAGWRLGRAAATRKVARYAVHPGYVYSDRPSLDSISADLAVLALAAPIPAAAAPSFQLAPSLATGDAVALVSYGRSRQNIPTIQEPCRVVTVRAATLALTCGAVPGTSGAPVFVRRQGAPDIAAIISATAITPAGRISYAVSIEQALPPALARLRQR